MNKRIPRKPGQPAGSKKHSDLYTDENPKGTIHGLKFATVDDAKASVSKIKNSGKKHAHQIQAAIAMEQRARVMGKAGPAAVYRAFINKMKKKTKAMQKEDIQEKNKGLWHNINQRRKSGKRMRKKGEKGAPSPEAMAQAKASSEMTTTADAGIPHDTKNMGPRIKATTNNSAYATRSQAGGNSVQNSGYVYQTMRTDYIMDVTDTSTHKVYFTAVHDQP